MKRFSCSESAVRHHFPELCRELAKKHLRYRMERSAERKVQATEEVKRLAYSLHGQGIRLTHRHIRPMLTRPDLLNLEEGRAALREVRREFDVFANKLAWHRSVLPCPLPAGYGTKDGEIAACDKGPGPG
jgi:hypothetical protein